LAREFNPSSVLDEASKKLKCDLISMKEAIRVSTQDKENRDLLISRGAEQLLVQVIGFSVSCLQRDQK
jgi:hypothetical protein